MVTRLRKSPFVKLFDKTPENVVCPHFYELVLSNGCPYDCEYCYLKLTFRGKTEPVLFSNSWMDVQKELDRIDHGLFTTGELADSLAVIPPLLEPAMDYFKTQNGKYLLLLTKSDNIALLLDKDPEEHVIVSFSLNSMPAWRDFENGTPSPKKRIDAAWKIKEKGWRLRIRLDPIILQSGLSSYKEICKAIVELQPEIVTVGMLRQYPGVHRFSSNAPRDGLKKAEDGRMRYEQQVRIEAYRQISDWLGIQPALCKETREVWRHLGWEFRGCNCTVNVGG